MSEIQEVFFAGGCVWGVQEFFRYAPGVIATEAGRANGSSHSTNSAYDGYAECVHIYFDVSRQSVTGLMPFLFEIIDPYSVDQQGVDKGKKYRTGVYSGQPDHLMQANNFINARPYRARVKIEVLPLTNFVKSDSEHQDRLQRCPDDYCHIPKVLLYKYKERNCR